MKKIALLLAFLTASAFAEPLVLPNLKLNATGTTVGAKHGLDVNIIAGGGGGGGGGSNDSVAPTGGAVPTSATLVGGQNGSGNLVGLLTGQQTMANSLACVLPSNQSAIPVTGTFWQATQPVSASSLPLPSGAATAAKQPALGTAGSSSSDVLTVQGIASMTALKVDGSAVTQPISASALPLPSGASTAAKQPALGTAGSASSDVISVQGIASMTALKVDGSAVTQPVSAASLPLPSGAATSANQATEITSLGTIATNSGTQATAANQTTANTSLSTITTNTGNSVSFGTSGNSPGSSTVSTVATLTAPASCMGFILMNLDTSTANIRYRVGATATSSSGQQLQPGRDTGFVPVCANISIVAESGTQNVDVQWVIK